MSSKARGLADLGNAFDDGALSNRNAIINGNFDVWQRGTSSTSSTTDKFLADRWLIGHSGATLDITRQAFTNGQTDVPNNPTYFLRVDCTSADNNVGIYQRIEDVRTFAGKTVTVSFYAKYHDEAPTSINVKLDQEFGSGGSGSTSTTMASGVTLSSSWQKFTYTATLPSISGKTIGTSSYLYFYIQNPNNETFNIDLSQVQLEVGDTATPFEHRSYSDQLQSCQRYFYRDTMYLQASAIAPNDFSYMYVFPVVMRSSPTLAWDGNPHIQTNVNSGVVQGPPNGNGATQIRFYVDPTGTGYVEYNRDFTADAEL